MQNLEKNYDQMYKIFLTRQQANHLKHLLPVQMSIHESKLHRNQKNRQNKPQAIYANYLEESIYFSPQKNCIKKNEYQNLIGQLATQTTQILSQNIKVSQSVIIKQEELNNQIAFQIFQEMVIGNRLIWKDLSWNNKIDKLIQMRQKFQSHFYRSVNSFRKELQQLLCDCGQFCQKKYLEVLSKYELQSQNCFVYLQEDKISNPNYKIVKSSSNSNCANINQTSIKSKLKCFKSSKIQHQKKVNLLSRKQGKTNQQLLISEKERTLFFCKKTGKPLLYFGDQKLSQSEANYYQYK